MQVWQAIEKVLLEDQLGPGEDAAGQQFTELAPLKPQLQLAELSCAVPQLHIPDPAFAAHTQDCCKVRIVSISTDILQNVCHLQIIDFLCVYCQKLKSVSVRCLSF